MPNPLRTIPVIRIYDPAISLDPSTLEDRVRYQHERDPDLIPKICLPGEQPVRFILRPITRKGMRYVEAAADAAQKMERAFAVAVVRVENAAGDHGRVTIDPPDGEGARPMADEYLDRFAEADLREIGAVAYQRSFLPRDVPAFYRPLDTSLSALEAIAYRRAGQTRDSGQSSEIDSEPPREP